MQKDLLLDPTTPFDNAKLKALEFYVEILHNKTSTDNQHRIFADQILHTLTDQETFWETVDFVQTHSTSLHTKFFMLLHVEDTIKVIFRLPKKPQPAKMANHPRFQAAGIARFHSETPNGLHLNPKRQR
jgi:hypothetical protein